MLELPVDREPGEVGELRHVRVEDRGGAGRQQLGEQPALGGVVGGGAAVIVEMVAAEIGEGGSGKPQAVDAVLVEAVAGGLDRQMLDARARELGRDPVQGDRVGRGQAAVARRVRGLQPERAEAGGRMAEAGPELAGEHRDRALAAGAGDGHHGPRAAGRRTGPRRGPGRRAAPRRPGPAGRWRRPCRASPSTATAPAAPRVGQEPAAVGARARHRREQIAGADRARVEGEAADLDLAAASQARAGHRTALPGARLASCRVSLRCLRVQLGQPRPILLRHLGRRSAGRPGSARSGR